MLCVVVAIGDDNLQPYAILILFFSLSYVSVALDVTGAFAFIALEATKVAGTSGTRLFFVIYALAAVMTLVANNDIVVLTLTPIVCYFTQSLVSVWHWLADVGSTELVVEEADEGFGGL